MTYPKYRLKILIDRADGEPLTDKDVDAVEDDLWGVMAAWLEARGLRVNNGSGMTVREED